MDEMAVYQEESEKSYHQESHARPSSCSGSMRTCLRILLSLKSSTAILPQVFTQKVLAERGMKWD